MYKLCFYVPETHLESVAVSFYNKDLRINYLNFM